MEQDKHLYTLHLTKRQVQLLSRMCDSAARIIMGQDSTYQEFLEMAWEKRCKKATGHSMDGKWDGGWQNMRSEAESVCLYLKKRFWGLESNALNGIHYDDNADIFFDLHRVLRHQLWKENPNKDRWTVDAEDPTSSIGSEPLARIERNEPIGKV